MSAIEKGEQRVGTITIPRGKIRCAMRYICMNRTSFVVGKPADNVEVDVGRKQMPVNSGQYSR